MNVAIAGLGTAALQGHLPALEHVGARVVAAADPDPARRTMATSLVPRVASFATTSEMLYRCDADVLVVATDPLTHAELVQLGLTSHRKVVCEKPLVLSRSDLARVAAASAESPTPSLVAVHQFPFSPPWPAVARWTRRAIRLGRRFTLGVEVERPATDPLAVSRWRDNSAYGGMLADHGVHFLALARTLSRDLEVLEARRWLDDHGGERSHAALRVGPGTMRFLAHAGADRATNRLRLAVGCARLVWVDDTVALRVGRRLVGGRRAGALSQRAHTDALYVPFWRDVLAHRHSTVWWQTRTADTLAVTTALVDVLERASAAPTKDGGR